MKLIGLEGFLPGTWGACQNRQGFKTPFGMVPFRSFCPFLLSPCVIDSGARSGANWELGRSPRIGLIVAATTNLASHLEIAFSSLAINFANSSGSLNLQTLLYRRSHSLEQVGVDKDGSCSCL
jgi:hypothetical protein